MFQKWIATAGMLKHPFLVENSPSQVLQIGNNDAQVLTIKGLSSSLCGSISKTHSSQGAHPTGILGLILVKIERSIKSCAYKELYRPVKTSSKTKQPFFRQRLALSSRHNASRVAPNRDAHIFRAVFQSATVFLHASRF